MAPPSFCGCCCCWVVFFFFLVLFLLLFPHLFVGGFSFMSFSSKGADQLDHFSLSHKLLFLLLLFFV